ncbi:hypothetical protein GCM10027586_20490 [Kineococcus gypseus]
MASWQVQLGGHDWLVEERAGVPGCYDVTWLSGPNPGYGFSTQTFDGTPVSKERMERSIADFLEQIDPQTGYLD